MSESDIEEVEVIERREEIAEERHHQQRQQQHQPESSHVHHQYVEPPIQVSSPSSTAPPPLHYSSATQHVHIPKEQTNPASTTTTRRQKHNNDGASVGVNVNYKSIAIILAIASFMFNIIAIGVKSYVYFNALDVFRIVIHILIINGLCFGYFNPASNRNLSQWIYLHICVTEMIIFILSIVLFGIYLGTGIRFSDHSSLLSDVVFYQIDQLRNSGFYFAAAGLTFIDVIIIAFLTVVCFLIFKSYK